MSDYRKQIETTEELARWYDGKYEEMGDGWYIPPEDCNQFLDDLQVPYDRSKLLLDVGCGGGYFLAEAQKRVMTCAVEISDVAIRFARRRSPESTFLRGTIDGPWTYPEGFDYVVSIGSLEHVIDLDAALENIWKILKRPGGEFYFYCPNEEWKHFDQPNERTMRDDEWQALFESHDLMPTHRLRCGDNTAFRGYARPRPPRCLNIGSGQRPFQQSEGWVNIDRIYAPDRMPV